jgi:hypothetical protein
MLGVSLAAVALAATALTASGCGSSKAGTAKRPTNASTTAESSTAPASTPQLTTSGIPLASGKPLSRSAWIAKAENICARSNTKASTISITRFNEYATALPQIALYTRKEARELSRLVPPPSKAHDWTQIVDGLWMDAQYVDDAAEAFRHNATNAAVAPAVTRANSLHEQLNQIAKRDGFNECAVSRVRRSSPTGR